MSDLGGLRGAGGSYFDVEDDFLKSREIAVFQDLGIVDREEVGHYHVDEQGLEGTEKIEVSDRLFLEVR